MSKVEKAILSEVLVRLISNRYGMHGPAPQSLPTVHNQFTHVVV